MDIHRCTQCNLIKDKSEFKKDNRRENGISSWCKSCHVKAGRKYDRSKIGLIKKIYNSQKKNSKNRGKPMPSYNKDWFFQWVINQVEYHRLYDIWVISGYKKDLTPSIDRIDDNIGYTEYNIQITDWISNKQKYYNATRKDTNNHKNLLNGGHKAVLQYDKDHNCIAEYISINEAARAVHAKVSGIIRVCKGTRNTHRGFIWRYKDEN